MTTGDILILIGIAGAAIALILIPVCVMLLRRKEKRLTEEIYRDYER